MKKLRVSLPLVALLLAAAYAAPQSRNIHEEVDPYTQLRTLFLEVSTRTCAGDPSPESRDPEVHLLFSAMENRNHTVSYFVTPELDQAGYALSVRPKGTLDSLLDGAAATFSTSSGSTITNRYVGDRSYLHETIPYNISQMNMSRLSKAGTFQFRVNGPRQDVQRCTDAKRMRDLAEFLDAAAAYGPSQASAEAVAVPRSKPIVEEVNPSGQLKALTLGNIATESCSGDPTPDPRDAGVSLAISANQRSDGSVWYYISTDLSHGATLGLRAGDKLRTRMDGASGTFNTIKGSVLTYRSDSGDSIEHEITAFHVHQNDLIALSKARLLEFRIEGPGGALHRCARSDQFKYLGDFIAVAARYQRSPLATANPAPLR